MTTSNDASGAEKAPDSSVTELAAAGKKTRPRKSASTTKKISAKKASQPAAQASEPAAPVADSAVSVAEAIEPAQKAPRPVARKRSPKAVKSSQEKAAETAPSVAASAELQAPAAKQAAPPKKAKAPAKTGRARKGAGLKEAPTAKEISQEILQDAQVRTETAEAAKPEAAKAEATAPASPEVTLAVAASGLDGPSGAAEAKSGQRSGGSRRRGSRGKGKSAAGQARAKAPGAQLEGEAQPGLGARPLPAAESGDLPILSAESLPATAEQDTPSLAAAEAQDASPSAGGEPAKKSRRRKRGKGGASDAARAENSEAKAADEEDVEEKPAKAAKAAVKAKRKMFVNVLAGEQVEVVLSEEGQLREYYVDMLHHAKIKGNIYKGVIHNIDPNLQAAFVSYGAAKNGFLQIDEVHPEYYLTAHEAGKGHKYPLIQKVLKAGQEILVQVVKEPSGTKGAFLTSYLSIPGRYLVLTPGREQIGVSRKVGNDTERVRLRELLNGLNPGPGLGVIVRTVSEGASKTNLQRDLQFLKRVWRDVRKKGSSEPAPALIYQELGLVARAVRDYLTEDVSELWVNDEAMAAEISEVITMLFPKRKDILHLHDDSNQSLFERFGLAKQIAQVQAREVVLPSGGRLVFDQTEALMAIDINSGRTGGKSNFEDMAFKINLEAAQNIPLQLRLRDIGGQIVVDFIEMRDRSHWREVEKAFRNGMKEDRARHDVGKISSFGLLEVVRQRLGSSAISIASEPCPFCKGTGVRRNMEWQALQALQEIQQLIRQNSEAGKTIIYNAGAELVLYLLNTKKEWLLDMEQENNVKLELHPGL